MILGAMKPEDEKKKYADEVSLFSRKLGRLEKIYQELVRLKEEKKVPLQTGIECRLISAELGEIKKEIEKSNFSYLDGLVSASEKMVADLETRFNLRKIPNVESDSESLHKFYNHLDHYSKNYRHTNQDTQQKIVAVFNYLKKYPELYRMLKENGQGIHLTKEFTGLTFTLQILKQDNEFQLFIRFKQKIDDWRMTGASKTVTRCLILKGGNLINGTDATVSEKEEEKEIDRALREMNLARSIPSPDIHQLQSGVLFFHKTQKMPFDSLEAKCDLYELDISHLNFINLLIIYSVSARAVAATHQQNIIHRDIKRENVLLFKGEGGLFWPKLADFGLAVKQGEEKGAKLEWNFLSPERLAALQALKEDSDPNFREEVRQLEVGNRLTLKVIAKLKEQGKTLVPHIDPHKKNDVWAVANMLWEVSQGYLKYHEKVLMTEITACVKKIENFCFQIIYSTREERIDIDQFVEELDKIIATLAQQPALKGQYKIYSELMENHYKPASHPLIEGLDKILANFVQQPNSKWQYKICFLTGNRRQQDSDSAEKKLQNGTTSPKIF